MLRKIFNDEQYILEMSFIGLVDFLWCAMQGCRAGEPARLLVVKAGILSRLD